MTPSLNLKFQLSGYTASGVRVHRVDCYGEVSIKFPSSYTYHNFPIRRHDAFVLARLVVVWKQIQWISHSPIEVTLAYKPRLENERTC